MASRTSSTLIWTTACTLSRRSWTPGIWQSAKRKPPSRVISSKRAANPIPKKERAANDRREYLARRYTHSSQSTEAARPHAQEHSGMGDAWPCCADGDHHVAHRRKEEAAGH